ncbi:MAG: hybrid sensor histidine kinase/response regulator [Ignavibacteriae bacterium]|nr:MAG: hybrid sensor histidine kinase/response regulator [Ignavibacteriota bacterium]
MAKRILCIEDDAGMRMSIRMMLEMVGYEMEEAKDGKAGVAQALKAPPDLIVCDIRMPILDGFQTLEELHKHESTAQIPFVFLTGEDPRTHLRKGMNLGASDFILKPIDVDDFIKAVQVRLEEAEKRKNESQRAIEELSESITRALPHELRTPMTGILGLTELLQSYDRMNPEEVKEIAKSLFDSAVRMNQTLEKFWIHTQCLLLPSDQAKLTASRQKGSRDAQEIAKRVAERLATSANRPADLVMSLSPISIAISERYLEHILQQLMDNAFKFSVPGTQVVLSTFCINGMGTISIKDQGRGMSEDQIKNIQMFMQFDRARHEQQGLGLGLMIAKRLTEMHGGNIQFGSTPSIGTSVTISFPLLTGKS